MAPSQETSNLETDEIKISPDPVSKNSPDPVEEVTPEEEKRFGGSTFDDGWNFVQRIYKLFKAEKPLMLCVIEQYNTNLKYGGVGRFFFGILKISGQAIDQLHAFIVYFFILTIFLIFVFLFAKAVGFTDFIADLQRPELSICSEGNPPPCLILK